MDEHKYIVTMTTPAGSEVSYGPFDSIEDVGTWAANSAINVEYWTCQRLYSPESASQARKPVFTKVRPH